MTALPSSLALGAISGQIAASPLNSDYSAIQVAVNQLITALSSGSAGALLQALSSSSIGYLPDTPADGDPLIWETATARWRPSSLTTATKRLLPGQELAYVELTSNVTASGTEAAPTDCVSAGAVTYDGAPVIVEFFCMTAQTFAAAGAIVAVSLWDSSTDLGRIGQILSPAAAATGAPIYARRKITPSAGSHTLKIRCWQVGGNGVIVAGAGGAGVVMPAFVRVTRA